MKKIAFILLFFLIGTALSGCTARKLIKRGDASMLANRPAEAERYYRKALEHDSDLSEKPAFVAKFKRARSQAAYKEGEFLANQCLWEQAAVKFSETLEIDPESDKAKRSLAQARAKRDESERLYADSASLLKQRRWDDAIRQAEAALKIYPFHRPAGDVLAEAKRSAAAIHCEAGNRLMAANNLAEAEKEFQRSLYYVPSLVPATEGLARADCIRGAADQKKGLWGSALLWYTEANNHISKPEYLSKIEAARSRVLSRISFGISVNVTDAKVGWIAESSALRSRVFAGISARKPQFLRLESAKNGAKPPPYAVTVNLEDLSARGGLVRSENRTHFYTSYRKIPNPEIPRLGILLQVARRDLARLRRDFNRTCHKCHGTGRVKCTKCRGRGKIKGRTCSRCKGTGKYNCPTCRGKRPGPVRGHGRKRATRVTRWHIERKRARVRYLQHQLVVVPATVTESFSAEWPYVTNHYEKSGVIQAGIRIASNATGATPNAITVRKTFRRKCTTVDNPNPRIGLRSYPLILPSNDEVRTSLIQVAGSEVAVRIISAVLKAKASEVRAKAQNASRNGNSIGATEAYVDLVHLMKPYAAAESAKLLERLRRQRR